MVSLSAPPLENGKHNDKEKEKEKEDNGMEDKGLDFWNRYHYYDNGDDHDHEQHDDHYGKRRLEGKQSVYRVSGVSPAELFNRLDPSSVRVSSFFRMEVGFFLSLSLSLSLSVRLRLSLL